ncbi:MAG: rhamnogalacturonan acetylesterase [Phycisphaeraceae bacterium JB051]
MAYRLCLLVAILFQITMVNQLKADQLELKNAGLTLSESSGKLDGWRADLRTMSLSSITSDLPDGVDSALRIKPTKSQKYLGFISQGIKLDGKGGSYLLTGYVRTEAQGEALLEIKLFKNRKELKRIDSTRVTGDWQKLNVPFEALDADSMQVLCRWKSGDAQLGKALDFAALELFTCDKSLAIIGDSTVQDYSINSPKRGWGQILKERFTPAIVVTNYAAGGRSTKTFIGEKRWEAVLAAKPDFVLIQFAHNDSHAKGRPEATDADSDYREYLIQYVKEARAVDATPILVTPPHRRVFREGKLAKHLDAYANQMRQVAKEMQVPLVDLYAMTNEHFEKLGEEACIALFCSDSDRSHFSVEGATLLADHIASQLPTVCPELAAYLNKK